MKNFVIYRLAVSDIDTSAFFYLVNTSTFLRAVKGYRMLTGSMLAEAKEVINSLFNRETPYVDAKMYEYLNADHQKEALHLLEESGIDVTDVTFEYKPKTEHELQEAIKRAIDAREYHVAQHLLTKLFLKLM